MSHELFAVTDCDGHILESILEMAEFMDEGTRRHALSLRFRPYRASGLQQIKMFL